MAIKKSKEEDNGKQAPQKKTATKETKPKAEATQENVEPVAEDTAPAVEKTAEAPAPVVEVSEPGEEIMHVTKSEMMQVFEEMTKSKAVSSTDLLLGNMLDEIRQGNDRENKVIGVRSISEEQIDVADFLEEPAMFYCYSFSHICIGDVRYGHSVNTPYNRPIRFKPLYRYKKPGSSRYSEEIVSMSCCIIRSKKEAEWVRNHTLYGIRYFENTGSVQSVDREHSDRLVEMSNMLNSMSQFEVLERAKQENLTITADVDDVRKRLAYDLAEKAMKTVKGKTHHKIAAASQDFNPNDPNSIKEVLVNDGDLNKVSMS